LISFFFLFIYIVDEILFLLCSSFPTFLEQNCLAYASRASPGSSTSNDDVTLPYFEDQRQQILNSAILLAEIDAENGERSPVEKIATLNRHIQRLRQLQKRTQQQIDTLMQGFDNAKALIDQIDRKMEEGATTEQQDANGSMSQSRERVEEMEEETIGKIDEMKVITNNNDDQKIFEELIEERNEIAVIENFNRNNEEEKGNQEEQRSNNNTVWLDNPLYARGNVKKLRKGTDYLDNLSYLEKATILDSISAEMDSIAYSNADGVKSIKRNNETARDASLRFEAHYTDENEKRLQSPSLEREEEAISLKEKMRHERKMKFRSVKQSMLTRVSGRGETALKKPREIKLPNLRTRAAFGAIYDYEQQPVKEFAKASSTAIGFASFVGRMDIVEYLHGRCPDVDLADAVIWAYRVPVALLAVMPLGGDLMANLDVVSPVNRHRQTIKLLAWHFWPKVKYLWLGFFMQEDSLFSEMPHEILVFQLFSKLLLVYSYLLQSEK
jgi:hypothetical protein